MQFCDEGTVLYRVAICLSLSLPTMCWLYSLRLENHWTKTRTGTRSSLCTDSQELPPYLSVCGGVCVCVRGCAWVCVWGRHAVKSSTAEHPHKKVILNKASPGIFIIFYCHIHMYVYRYIYVIFLDMWVLRVSACSAVYLCLHSYILLLTVWMLYYHADCTVSSSHLYPDILLQLTISFLHFHLDRLCHFILILMLSSPDLRCNTLMLNVPCLLWHSHFNSIITKPFLLHLCISVSSFPPSCSDNLIYSILVFSARTLFLILHRNCIYLKVQFFLHVWADILN